METKKYTNALVLNEKSMMRPCVDGQQAWN